MKLMPNLSQPVERSAPGAANPSLTASMPLPPIYYPCEGVGASVAV